MAEAQWKLRALDLAIAITTAPLWFPCLVGCAAACRIAQGPQVLFTQERIGKAGVSFTAYKFRTMIPDADAYLDAEGRPTTNRVTRLGAALRRTGLDEIPQLLNVIRGEMSLVGPRPILPEWIAQIPNGTQHPRFGVRPGLTGPAQVEGRNLVLWSRRLALDMEWVENPTVGRYLAILAHTPLALLRPTVSGDRNQGQVNDLPGRSESA